MNEKTKRGLRTLRPLLFALGGALVGLLYSLLIGCPSGACPITANPVNAMLYMGMVGFLLSGGFCGCCCGGACSVRHDENE